MDKIFLDDIRLSIKIGTTEKERGKAQLCRLNLTIFQSIEKAASGELDKTVDYSAVYGLVQKLSQSRIFTLLEEIALLICREVLQKFKAKRVKVQIGKVRPFSKRLGFVGIEVERQRSWLP